ncbi:Uncharacterised protein [Achromobacter xylosoxidans]|jgi:hypothetical protein|uniref:Uncharacterized protein n=1 Tax=Pseudomonas kuykendallii TaxID=1007099 RepID=A0A2W5F6H4_9PSED|nr:MAG: hypothetical protein DI599_05630 [Pseudomonas kuykendallii]CUJ67807.1 Uncharacterised protein [Achromobacter xylosoxidans]
MKLILVASGKKEVLKSIKKFGIDGMYENIKSIHNDSECDLFYDTVDGEFKALVDQSKVPYEYWDNCLKV